MSITRRLFIRNTAAVGAVGATMAAPAAASPIKSLREQALWHMRELERLAIEDGAQSAMIAVTGFRYAGASSRTMIMQTDTELWDEQGMLSERSA